jgi:hypothetical protein
MGYPSRAIIILGSGCMAMLILTIVVGSVLTEDHKEVPPSAPAPVVDTHQELRQHIEWCRGMIFQQGQTIDTIASEIREFKATLDPMRVSPRSVVPSTGPIVWVEAARLVNGNPLWDQLVTEAGGMFMYKDSESYHKWVHPAAEVPQ